MLHHLPLQTIKPLATAHLAQTMSLLSLTATELQEHIEAELSSNPALEMLDELRCPVCHRKLPPQGVCPVCSQPVLGQGEEAVVFISTREVYTGFGDPQEEDDREDNGVLEEESLAVHVFRQIAPDIPPEDRRIAAFLLTHLNEDGLLTISLQEIASYHHVSLERVRRIQQMIQRADPAGVGSTEPKEALLAQLDLLEEVQSVPSLARKVIEEGLDLLSRHQFHELARLMKVSVGEIQRVASFIGKNLNPYPGRSFWGDAKGGKSPTQQVFYKPDILISLASNGEQEVLVVEILFPLWGTLRVNPLYRKALQQVDEELREEMRQDLERASLFVKCLQQRNHTMQRLMQRLVAWQKDFIIKGEKHLRPLTRAQLAKELGVHESTISRAVANKAVQLPSGRIIPLSDFFDRSLSARIVLKELIMHETKPLSDAELVKLMAQRGYEVARRTVAKYRAMEGILPANLRRVSY